VKLSPNHHVFAFSVIMLETLFLGSSPTAAFLVAPSTASTIMRSRANPAFLSSSSLLLSTSTEETKTSPNDSVLSPSYDIEPIPIRIGHGFDIHRMAPIQQAGQPVVIGGVEIIHTNQKVRRSMMVFLPHKKECHSNRVMRIFFVFGECPVD
jgi:hypothetical protein